MALVREKKAKSMLKKSEAMLQHEKWTEETLKNKPKHTKEGLPIQPWYILLGLAGIFVLMILIGSLANH